MGGREREVSASLEKEEEEKQEQERKGGREKRERVERTHSIERTHSVERKGGRRHEGCCVFPQHLVDFWVVSVNLSKPAYGEGQSLCHLYLYLCVTSISIFVSVSVRLTFAAQERGFSLVYGHCRMMRFSLV